MASCSSSPIWLFVFAMLALPAYSEIVNELKCPAREDSYSWARVDTNCSSCADKCASNCLSLNKATRQLDCTFYPLTGGAICDCCCTPPPPPPPPSPLLCPAREDDYSWATDTNCSSCANKCMSKCLSLNKATRQLGCNSYPLAGSAVCDCCCTPPKSPSPPPPSPLPPPSPTGNKCDKSGDTYSEITYPTSDCSYCTNWCRDECSELKGKVVSNKCSIGESKFVIRCKCCCHENPSLKLYGNKDDVGRARIF
ncbi:hypothetical protein MKW98_030827 [Papaver atlanticum]|uniref:Uncharacterized protein n=1 Tax=Papaver atlanticum TaxID=357466 RepID=A0AAD4S0I1_9MAGN|nr:hypothetical protein MKW98_030827 [Papaver atlanticum]